MTNMLGVKDLKGSIADLLEKLGSPEGEEWLRNLKRFLRKENPFAGLDFSSILADWEKYYREIHNLKTDFSGTRIPKAGDEFSWLICRPEKFFAERAYNGGKQLYPKHKWTDKSLDDVLDMSFGRDGKIEPYIVRVRPNWEADEDLKNLSANDITNDITKRKINTLCLTERLLLGDFLYWKYKKHLDTKSATLCSGSRGGGGVVPGVFWRADRLFVYWCHLDNYDVHLRSRKAVS